MEATLTLHQAGNQLGVEDTTLSRLIRVGGLPEARKVNRPEGLVWVIPQEDLPAIARRNGWTIDLRDGAEELLTTDAKDTEDAADRTNTMETADAVNDVAPQSDAEASTETHPDLEGWDTSRWNQAIGIVADGEPDTDQNAGAEQTSDGVVETGAPDVTGTGSPVEMQTETDEAAAPAEVDELNDSSLEPMPGSDRDSAIEVSIATTTPVPSPEATPAASGPDAVQSMVEALDLALLERLLEAQEGRVSAEVLSQENKHALAALNVTHNRATAELEVERRERMMAADRYREERMARAVADAKVAELRDRLLREMALADTEKAARTEALTRSIKAERDAANAIAAMGWRARRRYRKLNAAMADQIVENQQEQSEG